MTMLKGARTSEAKLTPAVGDLFERRNSANLRPLSVADRRNRVRRMLGFPRWHWLVREVGFLADLLEGVRLRADMPALKVRTLGVKDTAVPSVHTGLYEDFDGRWRVEAQVEGVTDVVKPRKLGYPLPSEPVGGRVCRSERAEHAGPRRVRVVNAFGLGGAHAYERNRLPPLPYRKA